jgi:hypothetical protein
MIVESSIHIILTELSLNIITMLTHSNFLFNKSFTKLNSNQITAEIFYEIDFKFNEIINFMERLPFICPPKQFILNNSVKNISNIDYNIKLSNDTVLDLNKMQGKKFKINNNFITILSSLPKLTSHKRSFISNINDKDRYDFFIKNKFQFEKQVEQNDFYVNTSIIESYIACGSIFKNLPFYFNICLDNFLTLGVKEDLFLSRSDLFKFFFKDYDELFLTYKGLYHMINSFIFLHSNYSSLASELACLDGDISSLQNFYLSCKDTDVSNTDFYFLLLKIEIAEAINNNLKTSFSLEINTVDFTLSLFGYFSKNNIFIKDNHFTHYLNYQFFNWLKKELSTFNYLEDFDKNQIDLQPIFLMLCRDTNVGLLSTSILYFFEAQKQSDVNDTNIRYDFDNLILF